MLDIVKLETFIYAAERRIAADMVNFRLFFDHRSKVS